MPPHPRYVKPDENGRKPETWPPIPFDNGRKIPAYLEAAFEEWLMAARGSIRGLPVAAPLLVLICALYEKGYHLPTRQRLADALGTKTPSIDAALSTALGREEIFEEYKTEEGAVTKRYSIRRHRHIVGKHRSDAAAQIGLRTRG